jgi:DnaK suppressor protein
MTELTDQQLAELAARLRDRRVELSELRESARDRKAPVELDQASVGRLSRMDAIQGQQMALDAERRRRQEIARIDAALARMRDGEYGACLRCGEPISIGRLEFDPTVPVCVECAAR